MDGFGRFLLSLQTSPRRAALVQILLIAPVAVLGLTAALSWLWYARLSDQVQHVADFALAAAMAAPDDQVREPLARAAADAEFTRRGIAPRIVDVTLSRRAHDLSLQLAYDASAGPHVALKAVMPWPSSSIVRLARTASAG